MELQFCKMKKVLEMNSGDGCKAIWMHLLPLSCVLKMVKMVNFMPCICYYDLKKKKGGGRRKLWLKEMKNIAQLEGSKGR